MFSNGNSFSFSGGGNSMNLGGNPCPEPWLWRLLGQVQPGAVRP